MTIMPVYDVHCISNACIYLCMYVCRLLLERGYTIDIAYTSMLKRAIRSSWIILNEINQIYRPTIKSWRLNERMYVCMYVCNICMCMYMYVCVDGNKSMYAMYVCSICSYATYAILYVVSICVYKFCLCMYVCMYL